MSGSTPARVAAQRTALTVGTAAGAAGCCAFVVVVVTALANQSVLPATAVAAGAGAVLGLAGSRGLRIETVRWVLDSKRRTMLSWLPLATALVVTLALGYDGFTSGNGRVFWTGLGAVGLMLVGWVAVVQAGQDDESTAAMDRTTTVIELPEQRLFGGFTGRWWRAIEAVAALGLVGTAVFGLVRDSPGLLVFLVPALLVFLPGFQLRPYIVDDGIVFENYFGSRVGLGATFGSWDELPAYHVEDETLVIERDVGRPFRFDREQVKQFDRVVEVLESNI